MTENTTRMQKIYERAFADAKAGRWFFNTKLYNSEIKKLVKREKLDITLSSRHSQKNNLFEAEVSWKSAFKEKSMTVEQIAYANAKMDSVPMTACLAEYLYLETMRAININRGI